MKIRTKISSFALGLALSVASPTLANDSEAEWALGGLTLKSNADISMDSEELFISQTEVRVDYIYTNHSANDQVVTISFPLPALPDVEGYHDYYSAPDWDTLDFETRVDGSLVSFEVEDRAMVGNQDVTALIEAEGWPLHWFRDFAFTDKVQALPEAEKTRLIGLGLLDAQGDGDILRVQPAWRVQRHVLRKQTFAANKSVRVSHRYAPMAGGSVGGLLHRSVRKELPDAMDQYRGKWCIDDHFLAGLDRRLASSTEARSVFYGETWLGYVLSSGANWRGPIKKFRLVVDKGAAGNLVSFCMDGVTKISPTQFEVVKENFVPKRDLDILIVQFYSPEG